MALGQIVGFAAAPLLSRIYTPQDFGEFLIFSNIFSIINIIVSFRYEQAIMFVHKAETAGLLLTLGILSSFAVSVLSLVLGSIFIDMTGMHSKYYLLLFLVIGSALASGLQRCLVVMLTRWKNFKATSRINLVRPGSVGILQSIFGAISAFPISIAIPFSFAYPFSIDFPVSSASATTLAIGHCTANIFLLLYTFKQKSKILNFFQFHRKRLYETARKYASYPKYNMTQNLVYVATEAIIPIFLVTLFGKNAGGLYWLAIRVTTAPMQIFVESIRPIVYREISSLMLGGHVVNNSIIKNAVQLSIPFLAASVFLYLAGEPLFSMLFGENWKFASMIASILMCYSSAQAFIVPVIAALPLLEKQSAHFICEILVLVSRLTAFFIFVDHGVVIALMMSIIFGIIIYAIFCAFVLKWVSQWHTQNNILLNSVAMK
jgi:lipopolysaccharide exporter